MTITPPHRRSAPRRTWLLLGLAAAGIAACAVWMATGQVRHEHPARLPSPGAEIAHPPLRSPEVAALAAEPATARVDTVANDAAAPPRAIPELHDERALDDYLREIEARAAHDPEVAVMEIEDGIEAIHRLADQIGHDRAERKQRAFAERMDRIAATENADVQPDEIDPLVARYEQTSDARERDRLRRRYMAAIGKLGLVDRVRELGRMQRLTDQM
jgi:hypothetical protein